MREPPLIDRQGIVKHFMVWTLVLAVLFGSPAVSLALKPKAGGIYCDGPPAQLPPGKRCPKDFELTNLNAKDGSCVAYCCRDTQDGKLDCSARPVGLVSRPGGFRAPQGGVIGPVTPSQPPVAPGVQPPGGTLQKQP
jgi:hypothetical protein